MRIARKGASRDQGWSVVGLGDSLAFWSQEEEAVRLSVVNPSKDFNTNAEHTYQVFVSVKEVGELLDALAVAISDKNRDAISVALSPCLTSLLRLAVVCSEHRDEK